MQKILAISSGLFFALASHAATIAYVNSPGSNSSDFAAGVAAHGGTITTLDFEAHPLGALQPGFYPGVQISFSIPFVVANSNPPSGTSGQQGATGEGLYSASRYLTEGAGSAYTMTINFSSPVLAAGFFVIDMYNANSTSGHRVEAFTGQNRTGTALGVFQAVQANFQFDYMYFMGVLSMDRNIGSLVYHNDRPSGDTVYFDNVEYATVAAAVPEPGTLALLVLPLAALALRRRAA